MMVANLSSTVAVSRPGSASIWAGRALSGLAILFLVMDSAMKIPPIQPVIDTMGPLGWPTDAGTTRTLASLLLIPTVLYAWRPTAVLGAILITAYLGGAVATHARIGSPLLSHTLFGVYVGLVVWAGLWLRDPRLRALVPIAGAR
jgi:hypothetical protein